MESPAALVAAPEEELEGPALRLCTSQLREPMSTLSLFQAGAGSCHFQPKPYRVTIVKGSFPLKDRELSGHTVTTEERTQGLLALALPHSP